MHSSQFVKFTRCAEVPPSRICPAAGWLCIILYIRMTISPGSWLTHLSPSLSDLEQTDVLLQSTSSLDSVRRQTLIVFRKNRVQRDCHQSNGTMSAEKSQPDSPTDFQTQPHFACTMYDSDFDVCSYTFTVYDWLKLGLFVKPS